jgi:secreted Zn-dependent insulinase-like peptidase
MQQESIVPKKSPNDERTYEALELPNQIKLLFVHDSKAEKGACSISVGVGSLKDGERSFGLAHFL